MVLLHNVVEILRLPKLNSQTTVYSQAADGSSVGAALVNGDGSRDIVQILCALEEWTRAAASSR
jgi:hypothetical protein